MNLHKKFCESPPWSNCDFLKTESISLESLSSCSKSDRHLATVKTSNNCPSIPMNPISFQKHSKRNSSHERGKLENF